MSRKHCSGCDQILPRTSFAPRNKSKPDGYVVSRCRECVKRVQREAKRESYKRNGARREKTTGWGPVEFKMQELMQAGCCAICGTPTDSLHGDHDHETGFTRGLLCGPCNRGLGMFKDNPDALRAAANYIEQHAAAVRNRKHRRGKATHDA